MKDVFGFKKNKCKTKIPDMYTVSLKAIDERWGNYLLYNGYNRLVGSMIPANSFDYWIIPHTEFPFLSEDKTKEYSVAVSFTSANQVSIVAPTVLVATAEINTDGTFVVVSIFNPTSFDLEFHDSHKINLLFVENV